MSPVGIEPPISASEWPQTHALDRAATGTDRSAKKVPLTRISTGFNYVFVITAAPDAHLAKYYPGEPIGKNDNDGAGGTYWGEERYRGADKFLARPGRKQATATKL